MTAPTTETPAEIVKLDDRGRVTIGKPLRRAGQPLSRYWSVLVNAAGVVTLKPVNTEPKELAA